MPTFVAAAGNPNITEELLNGKQIGGRTYKNHLDGYNQMAAITGKGRPLVTKFFTSVKARSARCASTTISFASSTSPVAGWVKRPPDVPYITNLRLDPFERTGWPNNGTKEGAQQYFDWFMFQFWRFVFVQQVVGKELQTFLDFPPMQKGASFNLDAVKAEMAKRIGRGGGGGQGHGPVMEMTLRRVAQPGPPVFVRPARSRCSVGIKCQASQSIRLLAKRGHARPRQQKGMRSSAH